jgi:hypothetical protein
MTTMTRLTWASEARRRGPAVARGRRVAGERAWRSHTFADGVRSLTLTGPFDVGMAGRLWARIAELLERGCRHLIVDARAIEHAGDGPTLLAGVFADQPASCQAVVVAPPGSVLRDLLPATVGVTRTLTDARALLSSGRVRRDARAATGPASRIPTSERDALAIRQSLRWATRSAREGDYERALEWLTLVERTEGRLSPPWRHRRDAWVDAWREQTRRR